MANPERPDLSSVPPDIRGYIEGLEAELARLRGLDAHVDADAADAAPPFDPTEPPTTLNVITASAGGLIKRTPRHLYDRQRRAGMGIFDLESPAAPSVPLRGTRTGLIHGAPPLDTPSARITRDVRQRGPRPRTPTMTAFGHAATARAGGSRWGGGVEAVNSAGREAGPHARRDQADESG